MTHRTFRSQAIEGQQCRTTRFDIVDELFPDGLVKNLVSGYQRLLEALLTDEAWQATTSGLLPEYQRRRRRAAGDTAAPLPALRLMMRGDRIPPTRPAALRGLRARPGGRVARRSDGDHHLEHPAPGPQGRGRLAQHPVRQAQREQPAYVLDTFGCDVPDWVSGGIRATGTGLARGHWATRRVPRSGSSTTRCAGNGCTGPVPWGLVRPTARSTSSLERQVAALWATALRIAETDLDVMRMAAEQEAGRVPRRSSTLPRARRPSNSPPAARASRRR
ncbi:hypothetical protein AB0O07_02995 [Streptomyces sp. NPDC093085]|uniref:hypothetical protein n=1 Tax=Streptomyces sp. NPDC093085 TaxID=3155068 RepID=UPI003414C203